MIISIFIKKLCTPPTKFSIGILTGDTNGTISDRKQFDFTKTDDQKLWDELKTFLNSLDIVETMGEEIVFITDTKDNILFINYMLKNSILVSSISTGTEKENKVRKLSIVLPKGALGTPHIITQPPSLESAELLYKTYLKIK